MKQKSLHTYKTIAFSIALLSSFIANAVVDNMRLDSVTGDWVFTLNNTATNQQKIWRYSPRNQFKPHVKDGFRRAGRDDFFYSYDLTNDPKSKQAIAYVWVTQARMEIKGLPPKPELWSGVKSEFPAYQTKLNSDFDKKTAIVQAFIKKPADWRGRVSIADSTGLGLEFGWFSSIENLGSDLAPSKSLRGAGLVRPELPGVGIMEMQGATDERGRPGDFPEQGPLADKMDELEAIDSVFVPVLAPAISVPVPYNGAELAKNLKHEIGFWLKIGVAKQDAIDRLNRQFDVLIPALQANNKPTARAAAYEIYKELFSHHHGFSHQHFDNDRDDYEVKHIHYKRNATPQTQTPSETPLNRVAARALGINMMYLMTRMELTR
jgi:hypothetical protein